MEKTGPQGLGLLRKPFEKHQISLLPKPYKKDAEKSDCNICGGYHGQPAAHLEYVGHAALTDRLLEADINWDWKPLALDADGLPKFDKVGGLWIELTVCGQTRRGYGTAEKGGFKTEGDVIKEIIGDALRNAAMRFGAALDLWHKGDLHGAESGDYVIQNGKLKGKALKDTGLDALQKMLDEADAYYEKTKSKPAGSTKDDLNNVHNYLVEQAEIMSLK